MLQISERVHAQMVGHAYDGLPDEACGLLAGRPGQSSASTFYPCRNAAESSRVYTVDPKDHLRAERDAEDHGMEIIGVMHSHTTPRPTRARPMSPKRPILLGTIVIVSLKREAPVLRSYRIVDGTVTESRSPCCVEVLDIPRPSAEYRK